MSVLKELEFYGFRSFNPSSNYKQKLEFKAPITLLLGDNGCGKSTVIEILKFMACGVLPTGSKQGNYFIHYPKFQNKNQVLASAVLKFTDFKNNEVVVSKTMSRKMTSGSQSKCARNSSSVVITAPDGKEKVVAGRIVDVDDVTCTRLGVSKAVLDNVIFCEQDDSNWPLDEAKRLKEKFDAIFNTTVYNNLLQEIRKQVKDYNDHLKIDESRFRDLLDLYENFEDKSSELKKKEDSKKKLQNDLKLVNAEIEIKGNNMKKLKENKSKVDHLNESISRNDALIKNLQQKGLSMEKVTKITFEGTDEELELEISRIRTMDSPDTNTSEDYKKEKEDLIILEKNLGNDVNKKDREYLKLLAEKIHFDKLEKELKAAIDKFKSKYGDDLGQLPEMESEKIRAFLKEFQATYIEKDYQFKKTDSSYQKQLDQLKFDIAKLEQSIEMKKNQIKSNESNQARFKVLNDGNGLNLKNELIEIEKKINDVQKEVDLKSKEFDDRAFKTKLDVLYKNKIDFETSLKMIRRHVVLFEKLKSKEEICNDLINDQNVFRDKYGAFLQKIKWNKRDSLTKFLNSCESEYSKTMESKKRDFDEVKTKLSIISNEKKCIEEQLLKLNDKATNLKMEIDEEWNVLEKNIEVEIQNCRINIDEIQKKNSIISATKILHESYIAIFEKRGEIICPTCEQTLSSEVIKKKIVRNLHQNVTVVPKKMEALENRLFMEEMNLKSLLKTEEKIKEYDSLVGKEKLELEKKLMETNTLLKELQKKCDCFKESFSEPEKECHILTSMLKESNMYDLNSKKIHELQDDVKDIRSQISTIYKRSNLEKLIEEQRSLEKKIESVSGESEELREKLTKFNDERFELQKKLKEAIQRQQEIEKNNREFVLLDDLVKTLGILVAEVERLEKDLMLKNKELKLLKVDYDNFKKTRNEFSEEYARKVSTENALRSILRLLENVEDCAKTKVDCESVKKELDNLREERQIIVMRLRDVEDRINNIHKKLLTREIHLHQLEDELRLRDVYFEIGIYKEKIEEATQKLDELGLGNFTELLEETQIELDNLKQKKYKVVGLLNHTDESVTSIKEELRKPKYIDIKERLRRMKIQMVLNRVHIEDLQTYSVALDWSVMQHHKEIMVEINNILRKQWENIYKGNDFDYIEIKAEEMKSHSLSRRSYNYRVVYVRRGVEMDMRGHCSAGQRVLTSLLVRIALAEAFGDNCEILALDEPTANLDKDTVCSLAESLSELIMYQEKSRFQLILITHDEEFAQTLMKRCGGDSFYRISRNRNGDSIIKEELTSNLM